MRAMSLRERPPLALLALLLVGISECAAGGLILSDADTLVLAKLQARTYEIRQAEAVGVRVPTGDIAIVHSVTMPVRGSKGGTFVVHVYGNERDGSVPSAQRDLCPPVRVALGRDGNQEAVATFDKGAITAGAQFFIVVDSVVGDVVFPSTSTPRRPDCVCATESFGRQVARFAGKWQTASYDYPWSIAYTARAAEDVLSFRVDTVMVYPRDRARMPTFVHVGDVSGDGNPDIVTPQSILVSEGKGFFNSIAWPTGFVSPNAAVTLTTAAETERPLVVLASPGDRGATFSSLFTRDRKKNLRLLSFDVPTQGSVRALLPLLNTYRLSHDQGITSRAYDANGVESRPITFCSIVESNTRDDGSYGDLALVFSSMNYTGASIAHKVVSVPVAGTVRGIFAERDDSTATTTLTLAVVNSDGIHVVRAAISNEPTAWATTAMPANVFLDTPGFGIGRIESITTVSAVQVSAEAQPVLFGIDDIEHGQRLLVEDAANSDRLSSFLPLAIGSDKVLALFTADSCRPVHIAILGVGQSGETIWRRQPTSGLEALAGSVDGAYMHSAGSPQSDAIVVEKPGVVLVARPERNASPHGGSVVNIAEKARHHTSTLVLLRGTGMAQRDAFATDDHNKDRTDDSDASSSKLSGVRVNVLQSMSRAETRFNVECPVDDELLEVQVLSLDGRILHQWSGAEVSTQRSFLWPTSTTTATGTYIVRAVAKRSSHVSSFQRVQ